MTGTGVRLRHLDRGHGVAVYRTRIGCTPAGRPPTDVPEDAIRGAGPVFAER